MSVCPFKKYKNLFGVPGEGVHRYKFLDTAIVDYVLTIVAAFLTTYFTSVPLVLTTISWFVLGIILHILFGVETSALTYLGIGCKS